MESSDNCELINMVRATDDDDVQVQAMNMLECNNANDGCDSKKISYSFGVSPEAGKSVIHMQKGDIELGRIQKDNIGVRLQWVDLCADAIIPKEAFCARLLKGCTRGGTEETPRTRPILRDVSGVAEPGTLVAIIGASGAGKTTMLNALSRHNLGKMEVAGLVLVNNKNIKGKIKSVSAYVQQEDIVIGTLTVKEHLHFHATLRMDAIYTKEEKQQRVDEVLTQLGLAKCQDTLIGIPGRIKGISGGELKRLSFASELIINPKLLFVDEPTSGLDTYMAESCVMALQKLAKEGHTVITTIHQPSSEIFELFDTFILLSEGRTVFQGTQKDAIVFFDECGYPTPPNFNPADHYVHTVAIIPGYEDECREKSEKICDTFLDGRFSIGHGSTWEEDDVHLDLITKTTYQQNFSSQLLALLSRSAKQFKRDPLISRIRIMQSLVVSIIVGLIFLRQDNDQDGITNINGALFFQIVTLSFSNAVAIVTLFPEELPVFLKENKLAMYRTDAYFIGRQVGELPWYILTTSIQTVIIYWMTGLRAEFIRFLVYFAIAHMTTQCALSYGMMLSAIAPTTHVASAISGPCILPIMLFGGFFVKDSSIPLYFVWVKVFSWMRYAFELAQVNQWDNFGPIGCLNASSICLLDGQAVLRLNGYNPGNFSRSLACLLGLIVGFRILAFFIILLKTYRK